MWCSISCWFSFSYFFHLNCIELKQSNHHISNNNNIYIWIAYIYILAILLLRWSYIHTIVKARFISAFVQSSMFLVLVKRFFPCQYVLCVNYIQKAIRESLWLILRGKFQITKCAPTPFKTLFCHSATLVYLW